MVKVYDHVLGGRSWVYHWHSSCSADPNHYIRYYCLRVKMLIHCPAINRRLFGEEMSYNKQERMPRRLFYSRDETDI